MKKILVYMAFSVLAAGMVSSCKPSFKTGIYTDEMTLPSPSEGGDSLFFSINMEFAYGGNANVASAINRSLSDWAFDLEDSLEGIDESAVAYRENLIDEYLSEPESVTWENSIDGHFTGNYKGWTNYMFNFYSYKGGVHGLQTVCAIVFDSATGKELSQDDILKEYTHTAVAELLVKSIKESLSAEDSSLTELLEEDQIVPNNNFSVGKDGITWYFQPYEAGPYVLGGLAGTVSWKELKPFLK